MTRTLRGPRDDDLREDYPGSPNGRHWAEFQAGTREIWEQVKALPTDLDLDKMRRKYREPKVVEVVVRPSNPGGTGRLPS